MSDDAPHLSTRGQTTELADAIRYLQRLRDQPDINADLAESLENAIETALRLGDAGLRNQVQSTVGGSYTSIRQHITDTAGMMVGIREDLSAWRQDQEQATDATQRIVVELRHALERREAADAGYIGAIQEGAAAVRQLRDEFQQTAETINEIADDVALLKTVGAEQEKLNRRIEQQLAGHTGRIGAIEEEMTAFRQSRDASIKERRQLAKQLADLSTQLAAVLAHLPPIDVSEAGG